MKKSKSGWFKLQIMVIMLFFGGGVLLGYQTAFAAEYLDCADHDRPGQPEVQCGWVHFPECQETGYSNCLFYGDCNGQQVLVDCLCDYWRTEDCVIMPIE